MNGIDRAIRRLITPSARCARRPRSRWCGTMARSRRSAGRSVLKSAGACISVALVSVSLVMLANGVVGSRQRIECLQKEKAYLETRIGQIEREWNRVAAREVVVARAETELGLIAPDGPGTVVVITDEAKDRRAPWFDRVLAAVGGGGGSVAAATAGECRP